MRAEIGGLVGSSGDSDSFSFSRSEVDVGLVLDVGAEGEGLYDITGGGNSNPSVAFLDNCLAKSLACHHSRNFNANILVGSNNFNPAPNLPIASLGSNKLLIPKFGPRAADEGALLIASKAWKSA